MMDKKRPTAGIILPSWEGHSIYAPR